MQNLVALLHHVGIYKKNLAPESNVALGLGNGNP